MVILVVWVRILVLWVCLVRLIYVLMLILMLLCCRVNLLSRDWNIVWVRMFFEEFCVLVCCVFDFVVVLLVVRLGLLWVNFRVIVRVVVMNFSCMVGF